MSDPSTRSVAGLSLAPYQDFVRLPRALSLLDTAAAAAHLTQSKELRDDPLTDDPKDPDHTNLIRHLAFGRYLERAGWLNGEFVIKKDAA